MSKPPCNGRSATAGRSTSSARARSAPSAARPKHGATLDLSGLTGITLYEPQELVISARAGTALADIETALAAEGQALAFEPIDYGIALGEPAGRGTIGGAVAANLAGPRRVKAGAARDHFLGVTAVSGRGETFKSRGWVVKNVTGYDPLQAVGRVLGDAGDHDRCHAQSAATALGDGRRTALVLFWPRRCAGVTDSR